MRFEKQKDGSIREVCENDFDRLFWAYSSHDWTWDFSEDFTARTRGRHQQTHIVELEKTSSPQVCLAALTWAFRGRSIPTEIFTIRQKYFESQL